MKGRRLHVHSRLLPVVDPQKCTRCGACEKACPANMPIREYVDAKRGLVADSECLVCGKCVMKCPPEAVKIRMVWNRGKHGL